MPATSGTARVAGFDVFHQSDEVRRRIGYMPENNPLYPEMRVREYLEIPRAAQRARLAAFARARGHVMEQCGLTDVSRRIIGQLSKGYRQRVGLADALVHEPELIILDEPTIGLDPHQIRSVRQLIKSLAQKHTVLISTHILPEAEMMCSRMLIMFDGKILAADTPENLQRLMAGNSQIIAEIAAPADELRECFRANAGHRAVRRVGGRGRISACALTPRDGLDLRPVIFALARERGWVLRELTRSRHSLEDIYVQVTKPNEGGGKRTDANFLDAHAAGTGGVFLFRDGLRHHRGGDAADRDFSFVMLMTNLGSDPFHRAGDGDVLQHQYFWLIVLLVAPVITMRLFALEKATGTFETLMTTPVGDLQVVAAKFTAAVIFYMVMWLPTLACLFIVRHFTNQAGRAGRGTVGGMYLGIFLSGCLFLSLGCLRRPFAQPDGGGDDQFRAGHEPVFSLAYLAQRQFPWSRNGRRRCCRISTCSIKWTISRAAWWTRAR
jgi:ABC-2 type transport system ATP-binding protein